MSYLLALDQGTTSSRAILFDPRGNIRSIAQKEFRQHFPRPGWVEHDPLEIWSSQLEVAVEVLRQAGIAATEVAAIGITNQRETTVVWERKTGRPICNAIVWQDRRTADDCRRLRAQGLDPWFSKKTGLLLDPYFSGTKLRWILDHIPDARHQAERGELAFGTVDAWLVWNLTGGSAHLTDASNASRTLLYNIENRGWDAEILDMLDIPRELLPCVVPSSGPVAETAKDLFGNAVPITGIAGDQQAALFGQGCTAPGMVKNTYGTGCFMLMQTGENLVHSQHRLLSTVAWQVGSRTRYALEGSVFDAGSIVQWLRDGLGIIRSSGEIEALARSVPDNGGVSLVPAMSGLGTPHWDPGARGTLLGITRGSTAGHIARAAIEAIAHQAADVLGAMEADAGIKLTELRVDGGATRNDLLMQFQADLLGVPVVRPKVFETTALGAAYLAGLGCGYWKDEAEISNLWQADRIFYPSMAPERVEELRTVWARAVERSKAWVE